MGGITIFNKNRLLCIAIYIILFVLIFIRDIRDASNPVNIALFIILIYSLRKSISKSNAKYKNK